ncbi:TKL protein kinase [Saprolegnia parasitica CBS 223.65]|uniref:TKL protein kinase n=1 Tax=Saprolegnia parasitica (strain CBS 223.65) TaxID=695850 RepID=A0A067C3M5_SAPPC|nr:TKL protein kinase [Saprolegnia parasitica CBS 223.65]KDO21146.1 TKL protein kinase [Saprolegnia parasitica CBS 223.65]|eukprot:XP_012208145.1 TKL protein kinase [Saprolegnia parasitica CBS 223.65]
MPTDNEIKLLYFASIGDVAQVQYYLNLRVNVNCTDHNLRTPLHSAASGGHVDVVRLLLGKGAKLEALDKDGLTPLYYAASNGKLDVVRLLLDKGANVEACAKDGRTSLHNAASKGQVDFVYFLLEKGANVEACDKSDSTPLHVAAPKGHLDVVRLLLEKGAKLEACDKKGLTPLYYAASYGHLEIVRLLLDKGAKLEVSDSDGRTSLLNAASKGQVEIVRLLLAKGANAEACDKNGLTSLHQAASEGHLDIVRLLLDKGAKLEASDSACATPLHRAVQGNKLEIVNLLLEKGAKIDAKTTYLFDALRNKRLPDAARILKDNFIHVNLRDSSETPLLHRVVISQDLSLLEKLLQNPDLDIDATDPTSCTALAVAITTGNVKAALALLQAGASVDFVDKKGETAWHVAAAKGYTSILTMLQQVTTDEIAIDIANLNGESPLFVAATGGHADVVQCLLHGHANPRVISHDGSALLHAAAMGGSMSVLHQIVQCGVSIEACDAMGQTPLHIAAKKAHDSVVKYLLDDDANVFTKDKTGKTPLMLATHPLVINTLLQAEKSTKQKVPELSETMLDIIIARVCDSEATLRKLVQRVCDRLDVGHASVDRPKGTHSANVRVQAVCKNDASHELLADECQFNTANEAGDAPLHLAVQANDHKKLAALLRSPGINVDVRNAADVTPVTLAMQMGHRRLAAMLQTAAHRVIPSVPATDIEMDKSSPIYGAVYKGTYKGRVAAIKTPVDESSAQAIIHEMGTMQQCNSPYVQQLLAVSNVNTSSPKLILEYMDSGDLRSYLDPKRLGQPTKVDVSPLQVAWVLANALADLHHNGVFHHDLESYNVLLSSTSYIKVANLGSGLESDATTGKSTPYWTAPEVLASTSNYSFASDIYSFGVILTELETLQLPYYDAKGLGYWGIIDGVRLGNLRPTVSVNCPPWLRALADACMSFDPTQRPSALMIVESLQKLLGRSEEELSALLVQGPTTKLAEPRAVSSPGSIMSDKSPEPSIEPLTSVMSIDTNEEAAVVAPASSIAPLASLSTATQSSPRRS